MAPQNPRDMREYLRTLERLSVQQRAMPAMVSNAVEVIKEEQETEKVRHPAAPIELTAETALYLDPDLRRHLARLSLDFPDVVFNTDGTKVTIQQYELWGYKDNPALAENGEEPPWQVQSVNTDSVFRVDGYTPGSLWHFRARALGADTVQPGEWSEDITVQMLRDKTPPPQPTVPQLHVELGTITVTWDKLAVTGEMPPDFSHLIVAAGSSSSPTKESYRLDLDVPFCIHTGAKYNTPVFFRFRAVDESGNLGPWSEQAVGITQPLVDVDVILSEIDAGKTRIKNASQIVLEADITLGGKLESADKAIEEAGKAISGPGGLTERLSSAEAQLKDVGAVDLADLHEQLAENAEAIADANTDLDLISQSLTPLTTGLDALNKTTLPALQRLVNGKNSTVRTTLEPSDADSYSNGDLWEQWDTLGPGGMLLKSWRHTDGVWREELMSPTYLPKVDIGEGTVGSLSGGRLAFNSVTADALMVGMGENMVPNAGAENGTLEPHLALNGTSVVLPGQIALSHSGLNSFHVQGNSAISSWTRVLRLCSGYSGGGRMDAFPIDPSADYYVELWHRAGAPLASQSVRIDVVFMAEDSVGLITRSSASWANTGSVFQNRSFTIPSDQIPATAVSADLYITTDGPSNFLIDDVVFQKQVKGSLIVNGSIKGTNIDGESVSAEVAKFLKLNVGDLVVTGNTNLNEAVANKLFANIFATNKLTAQQVHIGQGGNIFGGTFMQDPGWIRATGFDFYSNGGRYGGESMVIQASTTQQGTWFGLTATSRPLAPRIIPGQPLRVSVWVKPSAAVAVNGIQFHVRTYSEDPATTTQGWGTWIGNKVAIAANAWHEIQSIVTPGEVVAANALVMGLFSAAATNTAVRFSDLAVQSALSPELVVDGAITAKSITASEELSAKVGTYLKVNVADLTVTSTAQMPEATIKRLWGDILNYRKITTNQLAISPQNYMPDPMHQDPETLALRAAKADGTWVTVKTDPDTAYSGGLLRQDNFNAGAIVRFNPVEGDPDLRVPVTPGRRILIEADYRYRGVSVDSAATNSMQLQVFYDGANKGFLSSSAGPLDTTVQSLGATWRTLSQQFVVPEGAAFARFALRVFNPRLSRTEVGRVVVGEMTGSELIVNGAITTSKLTVTEDMTVKLLSVHKVEAGEIDVNSLTADSGFIGAMKTKILTADVIKATHIGADVITSEMIKADAIGAKHTLTGPVIRTAATGHRIQLDKTGLRAWTAAGVQYLTANEAGVTAIGKFKSEDDVTFIEVGPLNAAGKERPGIRFDTSALAWAGMPAIFMEGEGNNSYSMATLVIKGAERVVNSTGRAEIDLDSIGGGSIGQAWGTNSGIGFSWGQDVATVAGKVIMNGGLSKDQARIGSTPNPISIPANSYYETTFTVPQPPPDGQLFPFVTLEATPGNGYSLTPTVSNLQRTGFKCRVNNTGAFTSTAKILWIAYWTR